jgi:hypothetical protein
MKHKYNPTAKWEFQKYNTYGWNLYFTRPDGLTDYGYMETNNRTKKEASAWWQRKWKELGHTNIPERIKWI